MKLLAGYDMKGKSSEIISDLKPTARSTLWPPRGLKAHESSRIGVQKPTSRVQSSDLSVLVMVRLPSRISSVCDALCLAFAVLLAIRTDPQRLVQHGFLPRESFLSPS